MMKKLLYGGVVFSIVMSIVGYTQQAAKPGQTSLDDFCKQFPLSASCPDGKMQSLSSIPFAQNFHHQ